MHPDCTPRAGVASRGVGRREDGCHPPRHDRFRTLSAEGWTKMGSFFETVAQHWKGGGPGMYPIALCLVFAVAVIVDRIQVLFFAASVDKEQFLRGLKT